MMRLIVIPQALRSVIPALVNEVITVLKSSSLVATIGLMDMMRAAQSVQALTCLLYTSHFMRKAGCPVRAGAPGFCAGGGLAVGLACYQEDSISRTRSSSQRF